MPKPRCRQPTSPRESTRPKPTPSWSARRCPAHPALAGTSPPSSPGTTSSRSAWGRRRQRDDLGTRRRGSRVLLRRPAVRPVDGHGRRPRHGDTSCVLQLAAAHGPGGRRRPITGAHAEEPGDRHDPGRRRRIRRLAPRPGLGHRAGRGARGARAAGNRMATGLRPRQRAALTGGRGGRRGRGKTAGSGHRAGRRTRPRRRHPPARPGGRPRPGCCAPGRQAPVLPLVLADAGAAVMPGAIAVRAAAQGRFPSRSARR
jgi:hypothetical protein